MGHAAEIATVLAWHAALNAGDVDGLLALSSEDIEVGGPRGASRGGHVLRDWVARAGICMQPGRLYRRDTAVVVAERAQWRSEGGQLAEPQDAACVFGVHAGLVTSVFRYPDVAAALAAAGLRRFGRNGIVGGVGRRARLQPSRRRRQARHQARLRRRLRRGAARRPADLRARALARAGRAEAAADEPVDVVLVGADASTDVEAVLERWRAAHRPGRRHLAADPQTRPAGLRRSDAS